MKYLLLAAIIIVMGCGKENPTAPVTQVINNYYGDGLTFTDTAKIFLTRIRTPNITTMEAFYCMANIYFTDHLVKHFPQDTTPMDTALRNEIVFVPNNSIISVEYVRHANVVAPGPDSIYRESRFVVDSTTWILN